MRFALLSQYFVICAWLCIYPVLKTPDGESESIRSCGDSKTVSNNIGKSLKEKNCHEIIDEIISLSEKNECKIIYPDDVLVSKYLNGSPVNKELDQILPDEMILDIGPKTINKIIDIIDNISSTIKIIRTLSKFENSVAASK